MGKWRYGVILDAGSSGTRVHIYRWLNPSRAKVEASAAELEGLPVLKSKKSYTKKIHPGVSTFGEKPELVGPDHLEGLIEHALDIIPPDDVPNTPIFLLATAGMRLLPDYQRTAVLDNICTYFRRNTKFLLPDCGLHIQVIPGETEGLYGWIAANYLLGGFDADSMQQHNHGKDHHTYGFLDMGGASAQIAFAPNATEAEKHADDLKLLRMRKINGQSMEYRVFVTTWLGYGVNEARRRYVQALLEASPDNVEELPDPCLPSGLTVTKSGQLILPGSKEAVGDEAHLVGTGSFTECLRRTFPLLDKEAPCMDPPCLLHGVHVPAIDFDVNHFVGVSEYWHTTHEVFEMGHKDKAYDFNTYQQRVTEFCSQDWSTIEAGIEDRKWGKKVDETTAVEVCFKASWLINMLHDGIGIPRVGLESTDPKDGSHRVNGTKEVIAGAKEKGFLDPFQAVDKINDVEVSWTLGKMLLYAASQIPPAEKAVSLPVGFGSNVKGGKLPNDFQFAGDELSSRPLPDDLTDIDNSLDEGSDWHDTLFTNAHSARRIPGLVLFMLITLLVAFLLCGRSRRSACMHKLRSFLPAAVGGGKPFRSRPGGKSAFANLFPSSSRLTNSYDRLELGEPSDFELGETTHTTSDSDSDDVNSRAGSIRSTSTAQHNGRTSGWATPKAGYASPVLSHSSPRGPAKVPGYFDTASVVVANGNSYALPGAGNGAATTTPMEFFGAPSTGAGTGLGVGGTVSGSGGTVPDRGSFAVRTESRDRLAPMAPMLRSASRNASRAASPNRRSPLMTPFRESLD